MSRLPPIYQVIVAVEENVIILRCVSALDLASEKVPELKGSTKQSPCNLHELRVIDGIAITFSSHPPGRDLSSYRSVKPSCVEE